jgi:predicted house-cleaning noncanonical NTP pyrophosphatase (MazG superfamily)
MAKKYNPNATYNKLVRDRIPEIIQADGLLIETKQLSDKEVIGLLKTKAIEEAQELEEAKELEDIKREMADILEILQSLADRLIIDMAEIEKLRQERAEKRGRFENGTFLVKTWEEK